MMVKFFESIYKGERFIGMDIPSDSEPVVLYQISLRKLLEFFEWQINPGEMQAYLRNSISSILVTNDSFGELVLLPPFTPESMDDVLVSGFMQTHNIKMDFSQDDNNKPLIPNWFIKGLKSSLKVTGVPLTTPNNPVAICEEAEVVLIFIDDEFSQPQYCGYTFGNDLTDIGRFKLNAGHLSYAKLCDAAISYWWYAELPPETVSGEVTIERNGDKAWQGSFNTGLNALGYRLEDMISHVFSFPVLHHPGRVHYIFLGADRSSYQQGFRIENGDHIILNFVSHDIVIENTIKFGR